MTQMMRTLITDDHPIVRRGLHSLISTEPEMELVGEATNGGQVVLKAHSFQQELGALSLLSTGYPLTEREGQVLRLVAQGLPNRGIAKKLFLSERTVGNYVSAILRKLHLANRTQAALYALREGLASLEMDGLADQSV